MLVIDPNAGDVYGWGRLQGQAVCTVKNCCLLSNPSDWENCDRYIYISGFLDRGNCLTDAAQFH